MGEKTARRERLIELATRVRPGIRERTPDGQTYAAISLFSIILFGPAVVAATLWLLAVSDWSLFAEQRWLFLFLAGALLLLNEQQYLIAIQAPGNTTINVTGSLNGLVSGSAAFIFGPTVLWVEWIVDTGRALRRYRRLRRRAEPDAGWFAASEYVQSNGLGLLTQLSALAVYVTLGGTFPIQIASPADWIPPLLSLLALLLFLTFLLMPLLAVTDMVTGTKLSATSFGRYWLSSLGLFALHIPFAIPIALMYTNGSPFLYVLLIVGVALVNLLAFLLSRANLRNQARSQELDVLEQLGQALLESPADGSELESVVRRFLPRLFAGARVALRVFADDNVPWPTFTVQIPNEAHVVDDSAWRELATSPEPLLIRRNVPVPNGSAPDGDVLGVRITAGNRPDAGAVFVRRRESIRKAEEVAPILQALADQIGASLQRVQTHLDTLAQQKMAQELAVAGRIQNSFLPRAIPQLPGWEIAATLRPARETSGDFYDFIPLPGNRLGFVVADVADKGTGAALYMALSRTLLRTYAMSFPDEPERALAATNDRILSDTASDQFVTVFYGVLDPASSEIHYANAGHNPAFLLNGREERLGNTGIPLGMFPGMSWQRKRVALGPEAVLVVYSDGLPEAQDHQREEFGEERMLQAIGANGRAAKDVERELLQAVSAFVGDAPQFDDITLLVVRRLAG